MTPRQEGALASAVERSHEELTCRIVIPGRCGSVHEVEGQGIGFLCTVFRSEQSVNNLMGAIQVTAFVVVGCNISKLIESGFVILHAANGQPPGRTMGSGM